MTEHVSPEELIKTRAEAAEKRKRHWLEISDEELKKSIDLTI
jgi:macrodomain Ter protein organizer (MatP/YcbG family)